MTQAYNRKVYVSKAVTLYSKVFNETGNCPQRNFNIKIISVDQN